jgi:hypothetical protein
MDPRGLWREKGVVSSGENDGVLLSQTLPSSLGEGVVEQQ